MIRVSIVPPTELCDIPEPGPGQKIDPGVPVGRLQDDAVPAHLARGEAGHLRHQPADRINKAERRLHIITLQ